MLTVSVIEDDDDYRALLIRSIRGAKPLRLLSAYATAEEAVKRLPHEQPAVALVDIKLPGMNGIECVRRLCAVVPVLPIQFIMVTGHDDNRLIFEALKAGALGYLLKAHTNREKLVMAIREVVNGGSPMSPPIARQVVTHFKANHQPASPLSTKEQEVLLLVSQGLINKEIADKLGISVHTVHKHLASIYEKLHVHSRIDAARFFLYGQQKAETRIHPKM